MVGYLIVSLLLFIIVSTVAEFKWQYNIEEHACILGMCLLWKPILYAVCAALIIITVLAMCCGMATVVSFFTDKLKTEI